MIPNTTEVRDHVSHLIRGSKLYATPFLFDELFPFVEPLRLEPILSRIKEFPNSVVCPIVDAIDADTLEYSKNGGYQVGGFSWSLHFTWRDVPSRDLVHRKYTDPVGLVRSWSMCSDLIHESDWKIPTVYVYPFSKISTDNSQSKKKKINNRKKIMYMLQLI